jgi:ParB family chromosome partitioning protein
MIETNTGTWNAQLGRYEYVPRAVHLVEDPESHGFQIITGKASTGGLTDEQKAERKKVRENNIAWPTATEVRQAWIRTELLARKSMPSDVNVFIATSYAGGHPHEGYSMGMHLALQYLDIIQDANHYGSGAALIAAIEKNPATATRASLAMALARAEEFIGVKEGWRKQSTYGTDGIKIARYLNALAAWGYGLSALEKELVDAGLAQIAKAKSA